MACFFVFNDFRWVEDTKEVITICKLKKNRQYNGQKKKNRQYNGQKKKNRQYNGQKKKNRQYNGQKKKDKQRYTKLFILVEFFIITV